jgi:hypothetical protein
MTVSTEKLHAGGMAALTELLTLDRDPILGGGTDQILATAADQKWTVIDMAADWANVHAAS